MKGYSEVSIQNRGIYADHNGDLFTDVYIEDAPIEVQVIAELR